MSPKNYNQNLVRFGNTHTTNIRNTCLHLNEKTGKKKFEGSDLEVRKRIEWKEGKKGGKKEGSRDLDVEVIVREWEVVLL